LSSKEREKSNGRAVSVNREIRKIVDSSKAVSKEELALFYSNHNLLCPLNVNGRCIMEQFRLISCRIYGLSKEASDRNHIQTTKENLKTFPGTMGELC